MTLINIEYGSLASSETLNKNFGYLEDKFDDAVTAINTSISSLLSNIATINSRLGDLSEEIASAIESCSDNLAVGLAEQSQLLNSKINSYSMIPNWSTCEEVSEASTYTAPENGYLFIFAQVPLIESVLVNGKSIQLTNTDSQPIVLPLRNGDVVTTSNLISNGYFVSVLKDSLSVV